MKVILKKRKKKFIKTTHILIIILINVIFITTCFLKIYLNNLTPKINEVVSLKLEKMVYRVINEEINYVINENNINNIFVITKNNKEEIISVDYDLKKAYTINNKINIGIKNSLENLINYDNKNAEFKIAKNGLYIDVPLFIASNNVLIATLGPPVPIKINFVDSIKTNLKTKITSYGLNNALSEVYVEITINELITSPVNVHKITLNYEFLIEATMINGRVPTFYGTDIISKSSIIDIPVE